eukprot:CAMPEP_0168536052 /NCGR_PEP_ID=MMETSP0405-20121227/19238_1 /TAXON_ID=498012 /ORGANISM="Trichosphaerium sp, Strain Am-I-7 wt" /LENGTH=139 /DNA_ID=CAMNT_0008563821 /DNA_START=791 /DNA_END=1210 /DNA_ORIENTATION=+
MPNTEVPEIILVKKYYPIRRRKIKRRHWDIKTLVKDEAENMTKADMNKEEADRERLMRDIEEDPDFREQFDLIKVAGAEEIFKNNQKIINDPNSMLDEEVETDFPEIQMDELADDLQKMTINKPVLDHLSDNEDMDMDE